MTQEIVSVTSGPITPPPKKKKKSQIKTNISDRHTHTKLLAAVVKESQLGNKTYLLTLQQMVALIQSHPNTEAHKLTDAEESWQYQCQK